MNAECKMQNAELRKFSFCILHLSVDIMATEAPIHEVRPITQELKIPARPRTTYLGVIRNPNPEIKS